MALTKDQKKIKELEARIVQLEKDLKSAKEWEERYQKDRDNYRSQLDDIHAMLDEFPNAPARTRETNSFSDKELSVQSRLSAWFSSVFIATVTGSTFPMNKLQKKEN